jgi:DNA-binding transcriptional MerR regulator
MKYKTTSGKMYYSISEVSDMTGVKPHVLRYWETEFPSLRPKKNRAGNRNYRPKDIKAVLVIRDLLYKEKFTISGARKKLQEHYGNPDPIIDQMQIPFSDPHARQILLSIKNELFDLKKILFAEDKQQTAKRKAKEVSAESGEKIAEDSAAKSP